MRLARPNPSRHWVWLLSFSVFFLASRGWFSLAYAAGLSTFVCFAAKGVKHNRQRYWFAIAVCLLTWMSARIWSDWWLSPSYMTFFLIAYLTECYWGRISPVPPSIMLTGSTAFSYVSAGPVPAPAEHFAQVTHPFKVNGEIIREAMLRIVLGLTKKGIADTILVWSAAAREVDGGGSVQAWALEIMRAARIYADFSGYADIAIGVGLLLGHRLPEDFRLPFFATSVSSYWRSWNASVSAFFIRYVFTPLSLTLRRWPILISVGVSTYITLCLSGLWHGFTGTQLVWGLFVGTVVVLEGGVKAQSRLSNLPGGLVLGWAITFYLMCLARVVSVEADLASAWAGLKALHGPIGDGTRSRFLRNMAWAIVALLVPHLFDWWRMRESRLFTSPALWTAVMSGLVFVWWFFSDGGLPFVYEGY